MLINAQFKNMMQKSPKTRLEAECPVKGSELLPRDSSRYELELHNVTLLYGTLIDNMKQMNIAMQVESKK